jgi:hypothetical protein
MPRNVMPLALIALIAIVAAVVAALAGCDIMDPTSTRPLAPSETEERRSDPANPAPADPTVDVARRYALAARNWTVATYRSSWERQIELAVGRYRRALIAKRPGRRELAALRKDRARSDARVLRIERDRRIRPPSARVLVTLDERTAAGGQTIRGATVNEVRLRRQGDRWLVVGWTVIPDGQQPGLHPS